MKKLLLSDSICKNVGTLPGVNHIIIRGGTIEDFKDLVFTGEVDIKGNDAVLLHVGTNNMARAFDAQAVLTEIGSLIRLIKRVNSKILIVVSGILPRLVDLPNSDLPVKNYNKMLSRVCRDCGVMNIRSYNGFTSGKEARGIKEWLYCRDGLHLSHRGDVVLGQQFRVQYSDMNVIKRHAVIRREAESREDRDNCFGYKKAFL